MPRTSPGMTTEYSNHFCSCTPIFASWMIFAYFAISTSMYVAIRAPSARIGEQLDLPAHQIGQCRRGALIGDHQRVELGVALEQFDREMARRAEARGAEGELGRRRPHELEELAQVVRLHARRGRHDQRTV